MVGSSPIHLLRLHSFAAVESSVHSYSPAIDVALTPCLLLAGVHDFRSLFWFRLYTRLVISSKTTSAIGVPFISRLLARMSIELP